MNRCVALLLVISLVAPGMAFSDTGPSLDAIIQRVTSNLRAGNYEEALSWAQKAVEQTEGKGARKPGLADPKPRQNYAKALEILGTVQVARGNYKGAEVSFEKACHIREEFGKNSLEAIELRMQLGNVYVKMGNFALAKPIQGQALKHWTRAQWDENMRVVWDLDRRPTNSDQQAILQGIATLVFGSQAAMKRSTTAEPNRSPTWRKSSWRWVTTRTPSPC